MHGTMQWRALTMALVHMADEVGDFTAPEAFVPELCPVLHGSPDLPGARRVEEAQQLDTTTLHNSRDGSPRTSCVEAAQHYCP
eukprot:14185518-Alexandrium_andersonii.AAC.1